jgi:hypothetical protein
MRIWDWLEEEISVPRFWYVLAWCFIVQAILRLGADLIEWLA